MTSNPTWVLKRFPEGMPSPDDFSLEHRAPPVAKPGELVVRTLWLSVDPYMRARLSPAKNYAAGQKIGEMMRGGGVGEVVASESPLFQPGDIIQADDFGWQPLTTVAASSGRPTARLIGRSLPRSSRRSSAATMSAVVANRFAASGSMHCATKRLSGSGTVPRSRLLPSPRTPPGAALPSRGAGAR